MKTILYTLFIIVSIQLNAQDKKVYQIYNKNERKTDFGKMIKELSKYDVVLFGEHHNNAVNHWLQLQTTKALYEVKGNQLILGAEMFERHQQNQLTNYLKGTISDIEFQKNTKLWSNYKTDYKPLVDFAKEKNLDFIATNVTRQYASYVSKNGLESLDTISTNEKLLLARLPITIDYEAPGYPEMIKMMGDHVGIKAKQFVAAQALKDATMAESILNNWNENALFLHYNGDYHSKNYGGIYWYLKFFRPNLKIAVIEILETADLNEKLSVIKSKNENITTTEFIIVFPKDSPKSY
ncbi:ChaN family lipoprotein [Empedobacter falsenii]|uniref:ChaN family lipoprotein n=1 Tax=Empedobacter falsenii TaxID=343874 RepID=A0ABY8VC63_9FLAO|nr:MULTISPECIES: ChaN family lipoprotein [Empedobacter]MDM1522819.1 ChaN family lipoprotein [Empedobacter sp. 225-1]MDM1542879.1 ChaN family lipoprotein [Empedobacter sp. 189-2]WIH97853.1 ChaN family lipoprotein [Empedobacter falsenii]HJD87712.1 ChaN family lipoprotein [Empedobacter falsenii]